MNQPIWKRIVFEDEEIIRYNNFLKVHAHPKEWIIALEEDCCPMGGVRLHYSTTSISWNWEIECTFCGDKESLTQDIEM